MRVPFIPLSATLIALAIVGGAACEKTTSEHRLDGPIRLEMGDCAEPSTKYVSGHKPEPFEINALKKGKVGSPHRNFARPGTNARTEKRPDQSAGDVKDGSGATAPALTIGKGVSRGPLESDVIRTTIESKSARVLRCYADALADEPEIAGTVVVTFKINRRGKVKDAAAAGVSEVVSTCVQRAVESLRFARPDGGSVKVRYPFKFKPGQQSGPDGSPAARPANPAKPDSGPGAGAGTGTGVAEAARSGADQARESARAVIDNPPGYQPGSGNPLREYRDALIECFRTKVPQKRPYGSIVIDLVKYQGAHAVVKAASDTGNDTLEQCVIEAIGPASEAVAKASPVQRCPLAFGAIPLDQAEGIDIAEDRVMAGRRVRAIGADIGAESAAKKPLSELSRWAEQVARKRSRQTHKPIANEQPVVIRPLGTTPVGVVRRVLETTAAAGLDAVLAVSRPEGWQPVNGFSLPSVPVPRGSGQGWSVNRHAGKHRESGPPTIHASLLIGTDDVWIGVSRIDDFRRFTARGQKLDLDVFKRGLRDVKNMKYFVRRRDLEIAAYDAVSYDTLVTFIDYATGAGFTEWTLMAPDQLSARPPDAR